jgi:nucleoside phosphorylase
MRVLVTFAVNAEFAPWRKLREFSENNANLCKIHTAQFGELEVDVLLTGIGGRSAWLETTKRVWSGDIDICISSGLAGALHKRHRPGDILAAKSVQSVAWKQKILCDAELVASAVEAGAREVNSFYSAENVILSALEKCELGKCADAVEMESGQVLYEAVAFGTRVVAIRGISDAVEEDLPLDFNRVTTTSGEVSMSRVLAQVAMNPGKVPSLIRFGQQSRMAADQLCGFLDRYLEGLSRLLPAMSTEVAR